MADVQLPSFSYETFFSKDTLFQTEVPASSYGVEGVDIPETIQGDNVILSLLLCCFVLVVTAFSKVRGFAIRQAKNFFYPPREGVTEDTQTASEVRFQLLLVFLDSLMLALLCYFYFLQYPDNTYILTSPYLLIVIFLGYILAYFFLKLILYRIVNRIFFGGKRNGHWIASFMFLVILENFLFFPIILLIASVGLSMENVETYFASVLNFVKLLTIYKCYFIFFRENVVRLQIILYFCALEMIPLLSLWGVLDMTVKSLII